MLSGLAAIVSIAAGLASIGLTAWQMGVSIKNQEVKGAVQNLINTINEAIKNKRLNLNKIISYLQNGNSTALMNYLQNNPVISRNLQRLQQDTDLINQIQAEQNSLETEIASIQDELRNLGYSQTLGGADNESTKVKDAKIRLNKRLDDYDKLARKAKQVSISTANPVEIVTSDLDARSQNINGGYVEK